MNSSVKTLIRLLCVPALMIGTVVQQPHVFAQESVPKERAVQQAETDENSATATDSDIVFSSMPIDQAQTQMLQWFAGRNVPKDQIQNAMKTWVQLTAPEDVNGERLLDAVIQTIAVADADTRLLLQECEGFDIPAAAQSSGQPNFSQSQNQLYRSRWLVQHRFYDDALEVLAKLNPDDVVDPASLLFYRAICQSELLRTQEAIDSLTLLQHNTLDVPERFQVVAEMLKKELMEREADGMKNVAELMHDVERRLDLGRSGQKTQAQEEAVISALDKLLEDLKNEKNKQQQQQQDQQQRQGSRQQGSQGADQSQIKNGMNANGEADPKNLEKTGQWGLLNNKQEAKAREMIQQKFPPNFLDQIGRYTRKIAEQKK